MAQHSRPLPSRPTPGSVLPLPPSPTSDDREADPSAGEPRRPSDARAAGATPPEADPTPAPPARPGDDGRTAAGLPWYRREAWLAVCIAAFVPVVCALVVPRPIRLPLLGLAGALVVTGLAMLVRHERRLHGGPSR